MTPQLKSGYIEDTLLDPHAANNNVPGQQMSFGGALGGLARVIVTNYQAEAKDPPAFIPSVVDQAQVFFEHSQSTASEIYNLWGQVPVKSDGPVVHYYNLTDMGVTHSGKTGVNYWFRDFIAPTLGDQAPLIQELQLNGQIDNAESPATNSVSQSSLVQRAEQRSSRSRLWTGAGRAEQSAGVFRHGRTWLDHPARPQPRGQADEHHPGRRNHRQQQRPVVAHHASPATKWTVPHARDSLLSHADHPTGVGHRSNPAAGTPGRRRIVRIMK